MRIDGISKLLSWVLTGIFCAAVTASAEVKQGTAVVKAVSGSATYLDSFGISQPLAVGTVVKQGQTIKTGIGSSVDLFLAENGPTVGLESSSELLLQKLSSWQSALGTLIDTQLDLKRGQLYGKVEKLLPGSNYEVKTPKNVAKVRGTEFYIDANSGNVYVVSGTVNVTVNLMGTLTASRTIAVKAGQQLIIPTSFKDLADFNKLSASTTSASDAKKLSQLGFNHFGPNANPTSAVAETFNTTPGSKGSDRCYQAADNYGCQPVSGLSV